MIAKVIVDALTDLSAPRALDELGLLLQRLRCSQWP